MKHSQWIEEFEAQSMKKDVPQFRIGDTIRVDTRIIEGEKERLQAFTGTVIAKKGQGLSETFTLYRNAYGSSMDRVFLLHSPRIAHIAVLGSGKTRKAKLYYLRGLSGKKAKLKERFVAPASKKKAERVVESSPEALPPSDES